MAGLLTRPSVRFTVATSPASVSSPYWAAITSYPSDWSVGITLLKHEPSAQIPWQNTMLGMGCVIVISLVACHTFRLRQIRTFNVSHGGYAQGWQHSCGILPVLLFIAET